MPGIVVFRRRWSAGSDDIVVPGIILFTIHLIWFIILAIVVIAFQYDIKEHCIELLWYYTIGYTAILFVSLCNDLAICIVSMRGSILDTAPRMSMQYWLYARIIVLLIDIAWLSLGIVWLKEFYIDCPVGEPKEIMIGLVCCNWLVIITFLTTIWCTFDPAGRSWVKMKKYQRSMRESESRFNYKRSGSRNRNWRQRKVIRAYQDSWDHRCRLLFCCMGSSERNQNSFTDIARLLSDFFRDLDVVPSDVVAGLVLLRKFQKLEREAIVRQRKNGTYDFLSGVPITERTNFLALNDSRDYVHFQTVIHYMYYAQGAYGWPMFLITHRTGICQLCSEMRCCLSCCGSRDKADIISDNCCHCNYAALKKMLAIGEVEVIYATYHVDVGQTPFFLAIDYTQQKIVVSIRGTLSMKDVLTDLNAEGELLPLDPPRDDWIGHKGMVQAAVYIRRKLDEEQLIQRALTHNPNRNTPNFGLVLVGHSLGAGTAAILAILLRQDHPTLQCYSYSPPGGLLSMPAVEYSKGFITSVVVGKDVVPRIGLHQMEALRADLINAIKRSVDPKWKTISCSVICCCCGPEPTSVSVMSSKDANINAYKEDRSSARATSHHPNDSSIALTLHRPLYPPGRIIHIVRHHASADEHKYEKGWSHMLKKHEPVYQAIWADNTDFDEVLISPVMFKDHMPDKVLAALNKVVHINDRHLLVRASARASTITIDSLSRSVVTCHGPRKPQRLPSNACTLTLQNAIDTNGTNDMFPIASPSSPPLSPPQSHKILLETSFTSLQSPLEPIVQIQSNGNGTCNSSRGSSLAGSVFGRSQISSILQYDVSSLTEDSGLRSPSGPSEATTVVMVDTTAPQRTKFVAFDMATLPLRSVVSSPIVTKRPSILHRTSLRIKPTLTSLDLIHDDWFGLAPLASPESLSEISSISSRASHSLATSIEQCLQALTEKDSEDIEMSTPRVLRRAPKITAALSTCADDWRTVDSYKRMGKVFITAPRLPSSSESSGASFESASSFGLEVASIPPPSQRIAFSADNLDGDIMNSNILSATQSVTTIPTERVPAHTHTASSSGTFHSALSSLTALESNGGYIRQGILESHFPVISDGVDESEDTALLEKSSPLKLRKVEKKVAMTSVQKKRHCSDDRIFARNESLPLLANLTDKSSSPTNYVRRKKYVYPMATSLTVTASPIKGESSV